MSDEERLTALRARCSRIEQTMRRAENLGFRTPTPYSQAAQNLTSAAVFLPIEQTDNQPVSQLDLNGDIRSLADQLRCFCARYNLPDCDHVLDELMREFYMIEDCRTALNLIVDGSNPILEKPITFADAQAQIRDLEGTVRQLRHSLSRMQH